MPVRVVVIELDLLGNLRRLSLQLLQAHDVRPVALHPFAKLRLARADPVDVPGGDFHFGSKAYHSAPSGHPSSMRRGRRCYFTTRILYDALARSRRSLRSRAVRERAWQAAIAAWSA